MRGVYAYAANESALMAIIITDSVSEFSVAIKFYDSKTFLSLVECFVNESHSRFLQFFFTYKGTVQRTKLR